MASILPTSQTITSNRPEQTLGLCDLAPGVRAVIESVERNGPISGRLMDLGLVPGTEVHLVRRAPLGDPSLYELRGYHLCLRKEDADLVQIRLNGDTAQKTVR